MIEVHPNLWVGDEADELAVRGEPGWFVVHACKEPFHRAALGYETKGAPKDHPEYLVAERPGCVILNLIDAPHPAMIPPACIVAALNAIEANIVRAKVLVHCNAGASRSPTIALLFLALNTEQFDDCDYDEAAARFAALYPPFRPAAGMEGYARRAFSGEDTESVEPPPPPVQQPRKAGGAIFRL